MRIASSKQELKQNKSIWLDGSELGKTKIPLSHASWTLLVEEQQAG